MKVLQFLQRSIAFTGIVRPQPLEEFHRLNKRNSFMLVVYISTLCSLSMFIAYESKPFMELGYSFVAILITGATLGVFIVKIWKTLVIYKMFDHFEMTIKKRLIKPKSKEIYERANRTTEKFTELLDFVCVKVTAASLTVPFLLITLFNVCTKGSENTDFFLPEPLWLPFNWKIFPMGYISAFLMQTISIFCLAKVGLSLGIFVFASYLMMSALVEDIKQDIKALDENWKSNEDPGELSANLNEIIQLHCDAKQSVHLFTEIYEFIFFINLFYSTLTICGLQIAIQFELSKDSHDYILLANYFILLIYAYGLIFIFSEIGERLTHEFATMNETFFDLDWNSFPSDIKRKMPMILMGSQKTVEIFAYGKIACSRQTFKRVVNMSYSFFTMLNRVN